MFNLVSYLIIFLQKTPWIAILSLFPLCHTLKETNKRGYSSKQALSSDAPTANGINRLLIASQNRKATRGTEGRWQLQMAAFYLEDDSLLGNWGCHLQTWWGQKDLAQQRGFVVGSWKRWWWHFSEPEDLSPGLGEGTLRTESHIETEFPLLLKNTKRFKEWVKEKGWFQTENKNGGASWAGASIHPSTHPTHLFI